VSRAMSSTVSRPGLGHAIDRFVDSPVFGLYSAVLVIFDVTVIYRTITVLG